MPSLRPRLAALASRLAALTALAVLPVAVVGCVEREEHAGLDATMKSDGYALFEVENERQQRNDVVVSVGDEDEGATYVLIYSNAPPRNVGWFLFDPSSTERCGGDIGRHCEIPGYGWLVDVAVVQAGAEQVTLRDDRCGCDADHQDRDWSGYWAVMRVDRPGRENPIRFDVWAKAVKSHADEPKVRQLQ
jgi:hypothetical protein